MKLILPAKFIPNQTEVTKPTGTIPFNLVDEIKIYGTKTQTINSQGVKYLIDQRGNITAISDHTNVGIEFTSLEDLHQFVENMMTESGHDLDEE